MNDQRFELFGLPLIAPGTGGGTAGEQTEQRANNSGDRPGHGINL